MDRTSLTAALLQYQRIVDPLRDLNPVTTMYWAPVLVFVTGAQARVVPSGFTPPERPQ